MREENWYLRNKGFGNVTAEIGKTKMNGPETSYMKSRESYAMKRNEKAKHFKSGKYIIKKKI